MNISKGRQIILFLSATLASSPAAVSSFPSSSSSSTPYYYRAIASAATLPNNNCDSRKKSKTLLQSKTNPNDNNNDNNNNNNMKKEYYRQDGVKINHDPYAPGMAEQYGLPGSTDPDGFDPYADTVGPGIYGGSVKRDPQTGTVIIGQQYQNHNHRPGPVYDGTGYSLMSRAIHAGPDKVKELLADFLQLVHEVSTGGATPLHICGMSRRGQQSTQVLVDAGADIHALDTYEMNALHRMASNNLAEGAEVLVKAGLDPNERTAASSPTDIARRSRAIDVLMMLQRNGLYD